MIGITKIIDTLQADWPLLPSLALVSCAEIPAWTMRSAQQLHMCLSSTERVVCQRQLPELIAQLAFLQRHWTVTVVLATLLALTVIARAEPIVHNSFQTGILVMVLSTILLPPLAICHGIARDNVAAQSLLTVIRTPTR